MREDTPTPPPVILPPEPPAAPLLPDAAAQVFPPAAREDTPPVVLPPAPDGFVAPYRVGIYAAREALSSPEREALGNLRGFQYAQDRNRSVRRVVERDEDVAQLDDAELIAGLGNNGGDLANIPG